MSQTRREKIIELLRLRPWPPSALSRELGVAHKVLLADLQHVAKSVGDKFQMIPPECSKCGFVFENREKFSKPSRCPKCKAERIQEGAVEIID